MVSGGFLAVGSSCLEVTDEFGQRMHVGQGGILQEGCSATVKRQLEEILPLIFKEEVFCLGKVLLLWKCGGILSAVNKL